MTSFRFDVGLCLLIFISQETSCLSAYFVTSVLTIQSPKDSKSDNCIMWMWMRILPIIVSASSFTPLIAAMVEVCGG